MPKRLRLVERLSSQELQQRYENSEDPIEKKRLYSLWCVGLGETVPELAKRLGIREITVRKIIHSYNADGLEGIQDQRKLRCGGKPYLDQAALEELRTALLSPPLDGSFWSGPKVNQWLEQKLGYPVSKGCGWAYLKRLGFKLKRPIHQENKTSTKKAEPEKQEKTRRYQKEEKETFSSLQRKSYPSDLKEKEWDLIKDILPKEKEKGRKNLYNKREILNGIFYQLRSGCAWRMLPHDLPDWRSVYWYFSVWQKDGTWKKLLTYLREELREELGRERTPSAGIIDSQSVKTTKKGGLEDMMEIRK